MNCMECLLCGYSLVRPCEATLTDLAGGANPALHGGTPSGEEHHIIFGLKTFEKSSMDMS